MKDAIRVFFIVLLPIRRLPIGPGTARSQPGKSAFSHFDQVRSASLLFLLLNVGFWDMACFVATVNKTKVLGMPSWAHLTSIIIPINPILDCVAAEFPPIFVSLHCKFYLAGVFDHSCLLVFITAFAFPPPPWAPPGATITLVFVSMLSICLKASKMQTANLLSKISLAKRLKSAILSFTLEWSLTILHLPSLDLGIHCINDLCSKTIAHCAFDFECWFVVVNVLNKISKSWGSCAVSSKEDLAGSNEELQLLF